MRLPASILLAALPVAVHAQPSESYNIYAIPSRPVVEAVAKVSDTLAEAGMTSFHRQGHAVHATLYLTRYPASAESALKTAVARIARCQAPFAMQVNGIEVTPSNWVFLHVEPSQALQRLADTVTLAAEPLRDHSVQAPAWMAAYPDKLPAFQRYGSPNVFMQYQPHLSLLADEKSPELAAFVAAAQAQPPQASGEVTGIGIGVTDANGQIVRTLAEYPLQAAGKDCVTP